MCVFLPYLRNRKGNALFLILIAVALFAALSYAITQSGRGGGTTGKEIAALNAAQVISAAEMVRQGVQRLVLTGTPATAIVTNTPSNKCYAGFGTNNSYADLCTMGTDCLFAPDGGGVAVPSFPRGAFDPALTSIPAFGMTSMFGGANSFNGFQFDGLQPGCGTPSTAKIEGVGTSAHDYVLEVYPLKKEVCTAINNGLGIAGISDHDNTETIGGDMTGKPQGCIDWFGNDTVFLYYLVVSEN